MPRKAKFPYRISVGFTKEQGAYLDALVEKKYFDSQGQAVRWFIEQFEGHLINLRSHGFDCVLPTMSEMLTVVSKNPKEAE